MEDDQFKQKQEDLILQKLNLEIQLHEVELKERLSAIRQKKRVNQSILLAIIGGFVGLVGTGFNSWLQHKNEMQAEQAKLKSNMILSAIKTNETQKVVHALKFLIGIKMIQDDGLSVLINDSTRWGEIPAIDGFKSTVEVQSATHDPLKGIAVYYNGAAIGVTNQFGQTSLFRSSDNAMLSGEFGFSKNGIEYDLIDAAIDTSNITVFWVKAQEEIPVKE